MNEERKKILEMLTSGSIDVEAAERLIKALDQNDSASANSAASGTPPKYLRVRVEPSADNPKGDRVNIRIPLNLIRAGMKWMSFLPKEAQSQVQQALDEKGVNMDISRLKPEDLEELLKNLNELEVQVEGKDKVRIYSE